MNIYYWKPTYTTENFTLANGIYHTTDAVLRAGGYKQKYIPLSFDLLIDDVPVQFDYQGFVRPDETIYKSTSGQTVIVKHKGENK